jgi:hypothetical protein
MKQVMLVSHSRTYTHFFENNLLNMADVNSGLGIGRTLRFYGTHSHAVSLDSQYSNAERFSLVRDPVQCISSIICQVDGNSDKQEHQYKRVIKEWIDFHEKILEEKNISLVWCKDLKFRPLETFTNIITDVLGLEVLRDTVMGQDSMQDKNYKNSNFNTPQYKKIHRYVSSTDLSQPYSMYSELVKRSIQI